MATHRAHMVEVYAGLGQATPDELGAAWQYAYTVTAQSLGPAAAGVSRVA